MDNLQEQIKICGYHESLNFKDSIKARCHYKYIQKAIKKIPVQIFHRHKGMCAYFYGTSKIIVLYPEHFLSAQHYWRAVFHEIGHWTANKTGRALEYGMEECVAESIAISLQYHFCLTPDLAYISKWLDTKNMSCVVDHANEGLKVLNKFLLD